MRNRFSGKSMPIFCLLATSLYSSLALAGWSDAQSQGPYPKKFGDFPPLDIDQQLQQNLATEKRPEKKQEQQVASLPRSKASSVTGSAVNKANIYQSNTNPPQDSSSKQYQQANALSHNPGNQQVINPALNPALNNVVLPGKHKQKHKAGFGLPGDNKGSGFSAPWSNSGSSFSAPWNNRRSSFSGPWNNNGSSFSVPWDNNNSSFSFPWGNNNAGFGPWGNNRHR